MQCFLRFAALGMLLGLLLPALAAQGAAPEVKHLDPKQFALRATEPGVVILDVRTAREVKSGIISGARHLDFYAPDFSEQIARLDKKTTYLVYCASGLRSTKACMKMMQMGFTNVFNLDRGVMNWQRAGLPLQK